MGSLSDALASSSLTLTETTAPLTRSTTSAKDEGPASVAEAAAARAGWLAIGRASKLTAPTAARAAAPSSAARSDFGRLEKVLGTSSSPSLAQSPVKSFIRRDGDHMC